LESLHHKNNKDAMQTRIKHTAFAAVAFCAGAFLLQPVTAQDQRPAPTLEKRAVAPFHALELSGPFRVVVSPGAPSLELSGAPSALAGIESEVRGGTLYVRQKSRWGIHLGPDKKRDEVVVRIGAANLRSLSTGGSGDVELERVGGERFSLASNGPGDVRARGAVRELLVTSSGSGDLDLRQLKADKLDLTMSGPGDVRAAGIGKELSARVSGSGDLEADALDLARAVARITGPGNARLRGSARDLRAEVSGSGDFDGCDLQAEKVATVQRGPGNACVAGAIRQLEAEVHGSGDLAAKVEGKRVQLQMRGPGNVRLEGHADRIRAELSGSGTLQARRLSVRQSDIDVRGPGNAAVNQARDGEQDNVMLVGRAGARWSDCRTAAWLFVGWAPRAHALRAYPFPLAAPRFRRVGSRAHAVWYASSPRAASIDRSAIQTVRPRGLESPPYNCVTTRSSRHGTIPIPIPA